MHDISRLHTKWCSVAMTLLKYWTSPIGLTTLSRNRHPQKRKRKRRITPGLTWLGRAGLCASHIFNLYLKDLSDIENVCDFQNWRLLQNGSPWKAIDKISSSKARCLCCNVTDYEVKIKETTLIFYANLIDYYYFFYQNLQHGRCCDKG